MANVKIINSFSLECLKNDILTEIEFADSQINVFQNELDREEQHKRDEITIIRLRNSKGEWCTKRNTLHQCLCKITNASKEIEI